MRLDFEWNHITTGNHRIQATAVIRSAAEAGGKPTCFLKIHANLPQKDAVSIHAKQ